MEPSHSSEYLASRANLVTRALAAMLDGIIMDYGTHLIHGTFAFFVGPREMAANATLTILSGLIVIALISAYATQAQATPGKSLLGLKFSPSFKSLRFYTLFFRTLMLYGFYPINAILLLLGKNHLGERYSGIFVIASKPTSSQVSFAKTFVFGVSLAVCGSLLSYYHPVFYTNMKGLQSHVQKILDGPDSPRKQLYQKALEDSGRTVEDLVGAREGRMSRYKNGTLVGTYQKYQFEWRVFGYRYWTSIDSPLVEAHN